MVNKEDKDKRMNDLVEKFIDNTTRENLLNMLLPIHSHAEIENDRDPNQIVYREEDIVIIISKVTMASYRNASIRALEIVRKGLTNE